MDFYHRFIGFCGQNYKSSFIFQTNHRTKYNTGASYLENVFFLFTDSIHRIRLQGLEFGNIGFHSKNPVCPWQLPLWHWWPDFFHEITDIQFHSMLWFFSDRCNISRADITSEMSLPNSLIYVVLYLFKFICYVRINIISATHNTSFLIYRFNLVK